VTLEPEARRLAGVAVALEGLARRMQAGSPTPEVLDEAIVHLRGIRRRAFGPRVLSGSARERILAYLSANQDRWVTGDELAEVAGISEWARRVRELRQDGHSIAESVGNYRLLSGTESSRDHR
jgi:biotin operon repressor